MSLSLLCDEHVPYPIIEGLKRRGLRYRRSNPQHHFGM